MTSAPVSAKPSAARVVGPVLGALALLYFAQGVPFGIATEYLTVRLRRAQFTQVQLFLLGFLQLPWYLKTFWAHAGDHPFARRHSRHVLLAFQLCLSLGTALFALHRLDEARTYWFALTLACALFAATQDIFVDALAVRTLGAADRGLGNILQVAGYRVGMIAGGSVLLVLTATIGEGRAVGIAATLIALASLGAFLLRAPVPAYAGVVLVADEGPRLPAIALLKHMTARAAWPVLAVALTYKLGIHLASGLLKPMTVDHGWSDARIGTVIATVGTGCALFGAIAGGLVYRPLGEVRALRLGVLLQALACVPLVLAERWHSPLAFTTGAIAVENFTSGLGTTILFAALMTATRPTDAGRHYTFLSTANILALTAGGGLGAFLADHLGRAPVYALGAVIGLVPLAFLPRWERAARASAA